MTAPLLLDGATGTQLRARGIEVPDHTTSIWSAQALLDAPDAVVAVHRDYFLAGADVVTANNYAVTRPLLSRVGWEDRLEELTVLAAELACRARDAAGGGRIAGSMPPLDTSYCADLVGPDDEIRAEYEKMARALAGHVDVLLCETMASAREARAAVSAAKATGIETWLSFTLQGDRENTLPSGESLADAWAQLEPLAPDAVLVNCCGANLATSAMTELAPRVSVPFGGYAHTADVTLADEGAEPTALGDLDYTPLSIEAYTHAASGWLDAGARIIGGCCSTGPDHVRALRALLDSREA